MAEEAAPDQWPELPVAAWEATRDTLHLWTQVVGKVRVALEPMINHWWQAPLYVTARGLTTGLMPHGVRGVEMEFDFIRHVLDVRTAEGTERQVRLEPRSVADFYAETMARLADLDMPVEINPLPQEVMVAIPFPDDEDHASYDADLPSGSGGHWCRPIGYSPSSGRDSLGRSARFTSSGVPSTWR
jgi:hypothetical protein